MPSKEIFTIREFQIADGEEEPELYSRAYALPQFFTTNFVHESRIVKMFTGQNALLKKVELNTTPNDLGSIQQNNSFKKTESSYFSQNPPRSSQSQIEFDEQESENKSKLLEINCNLIRRRSKNSTLKQTKKVSLLEQKSSFQYEEENDNGNSSLAHSGIKSENQDDEKEGAHTLINILDSRVTENNCGFTTLPSSLLQNGVEKFSIITRRNKRKSLTMFESNIKEEQEKNTPSLTDSAKYLLRIQNEFELPINLPQPKMRNQKVTTSSQNIYTNAASCYTFKTTVVRMEEIIELGEDEDTQNSIQQFCEVQCPNPSMSERTVNLSENVSHKIMIEIIQSRNINISKTSIGQSITTPYIMDGKPSFFEDQDASRDNSLSVSRNEKLEKSVFYRNQSRKLEEEKKSFDEFMKEMKQKLPFTEKHKNQVESALNTGSKKIFNTFEPGIFKQTNEKKTSEKNFYQTPKNVSPQMKVHASFKTQHPIGFQASSKHFFKIKENGQEFFDNQMTWMPSGSDEFTRSDILILLDEEYRSKIRAIKNEYKSAINEDQGSMMYKENLRSGIQNQNISLMKESRQTRTKNENQKKNYEMNNNSRMSSRQRETSIYVDER